jgi:hypothetical protein
MNKKIITTLLTLVLVLTSTTLINKASAEEKPATVAILDTAIDSTLPIFKDKLVHEVCILAFNSCPNKKNFMEGPGSALLPLNHLSRNGFDHGTQMASILVNENPNINFVFVRIIGNTVSGGRQLTPESTISSALNWVENNRVKFNIQAVTMSQGHHNLLNSANYCPKTTNTDLAVKRLKSAGVPVFFPAGNGKDYKRIDWPACLPDSIAIGGSSREDQIATFGNYDANLIDFFAPAYRTASLPGGRVINAAGTSVSTQVAAAQWLRIKELNSNVDTYSLILSKSKTIIGIKGMLGKMIDLDASLNG